MSSWFHGAQMMVISTLSLYACIPSFLIFTWPLDTIHNSDLILGCLLTPWEVTQCHSNHFRPFWCFWYVFIHFQCLLAYIWHITTLTNYLCVLHIIVYIFDMFLTLPNLLLSLFIFTVIDVAMFQLFIVLADCASSIGLDFDTNGLSVISDISDAILTSLRSSLLIYHLALLSKTQ